MMLRNYSNKGATIGSAKFKNGNKANIEAVPKANLPRTMSKSWSLARNSQTDAGVTLEVIWEICQVNHNNIEMLLCCVLPIQRFQRVGKWWWVLIWAPNQLGETFSQLWWRYPGKWRWGIFKNMSTDLPAEENIPSLNLFKDWSGGVGVLQWCEDDSGDNPCDGPDDSDHCSESELVDDSTWWQETVECSIEVNAKITQTDQTLLDSINHVQSWNMFCVDLALTGEGLGHLSTGAGSLQAYQCVTSTLLHSSLSSRFTGSCCSLSSRVQTVKHIFSLGLKTNTS